MPAPPAPEPKVDASKPGIAAPERPIYFAFDSSQLRPESTDLLRQMADYLQQSPRSTLTIEGHTCDIGTTEYNLALGGRRAAAAREYLLRLGIEPGRVSTLSYGEERPAVQGHDEASRSKNRRDEFAVQTSDLRADR
jgi:peptidoglycan-associated lipoprotein